jgi:ribose 1,5-bisphosphokinase PhnN
MTSLNLFEESFPLAAITLSKIFSENSDKRICVVGPSCVGKSTLLKYLPEAVDMDTILFGDKSCSVPSLLSEEEINYVCGPWTPEIGLFMADKARELICIEAGRPVFGTIVFPSDLIIVITLPDDILIERIYQRGSNMEDVFNMKKQIEEEVNNSGIEKIVVENI